MDAGNGRKFGSPFAKKKKPSTDILSPPKHSKVSTVPKKDLSSYFAVKGTQDHQIVDEDGVIHLLDDKCPDFSKSHVPRCFPEEDLHKSSEGLQTSISSLKKVPYPNDGDELFDDADLGFPLELLEQVVSKYDKPSSSIGQEYIESEQFSVLESASPNCKHLDRVQNISENASEYINEECCTVKVECDEYPKPGFNFDKSTVLVDVKCKDVYDASSAFRDDLFFDEDSCDITSEISTPSETHQEGSDLSFRDSFYKGGTDWSALYDIDEYGLPCGREGSPSFSSEQHYHSAKEPGEIRVLESKVSKLDSSSLPLPINLQSPSSLGLNPFRENDVNFNVAAKRFTKLKQVDLSGFLKLKPKATPKENVSALKAVQQDIGTYFGLSPLAKPPPSLEAASFISKFQQSGSSPASSSGKNLQRKGGGGGGRWKSKDQATRSCPFYKKMPGTPFTVDAFKFGAVDGCKAYFLSHFHSDHYGGLTRSWCHGPIFCTPVTARLVAMCLGVDSQWLHPVKLGVTLVVEGVEVQFLEANHCPGAALILFQTQSGQRILHTGDFRACKNMQTYPELLCARVTSLYLDTTYCNPKYNFPLQEDVIDFVIKVTSTTLKRNPKTLVAVGAYSIGKERVYMGIAKALNLMIFADKRRARILSSLEWPELTDRLCDDSSRSLLHVLPISHLNSAKLKSYMQSFCPRYTAVLGFRPTGWTYTEKLGSNLEQLKPQCSGAVTVYGVPYSEHSSFSELQEFVQFLRPQRIIATVNIGTAAQREGMQSHFNQWLRS